MKKLSHNDYVSYVSRLDDIIVLDTYVNDRTKILHKHSCGYEWLARPNSIKRGQSCPKCYGNNKTHMEYIDELSKKRPDIVALDDYKSYHEKILHRHNCGYEWMVSPASIILNKSCPSCAGNKKLNNIAYHYKLSEKYIPLDSYSNTMTPILHRCNDCGNEWMVRPHDLIILGRGCPKCSLSNYSKISIDWIKSFNNLNIQHAENIGEYKIPGTNWKVDGYDPTTNTVYEFLGDYWHGNPEVYEAHEINEISKKPMKELFEETISRLIILRDMGYNVVYCWESDWINIRNKI